MGRRNANVESPRQSNRKPKPQRGNRHENPQRDNHEQESLPLKEFVNRKPVTAKTEVHQYYLDSIRSQIITFATGPAGTGKTYMAACVAAEMLMAKEIDKIVVCRPQVTAGEDQGFLPGDEDEKFDPYFRPVRAVLEERLGKSFVKYLIEVGRIETGLLGYMRGTTFKNAFVILDEAQNTTPEQMEMFLTRIGENTRYVVNGDTKQSDIDGTPGISDGLRKIGKLPDVTHIEFTMDDCVRSPMCKAILRAYGN